jgi:hypothetical protein
MTFLTSRPPSPAEGKEVARKGLVFGHSGDAPLCAVGLFWRKIYAPRLAFLLSPRLPLYGGKANKDRNAFSAALQLLNSNVRQLCEYNGVVVKHGNQTLPNLRRLILHFQDVTTVGGRTCSRGRQSGE